VSDENNKATEKFISNKRINTYVTIAWVVSIFTLIFLRSKGFIDPTSSIGQLLPIIVFIGGMVVWAIFRLLLLKCPNCNTSFFLQKSTPSSCPKCQLALKK